MAKFWSKSDRERISRQMKEVWRARRKVEKARKAKQAAPAQQKTINVIVRTKPVRFIAYGYEDGLKKLHDDEFETLQDAVPALLDLIYGGTAIDRIELLVK